MELKTVPSKNPTPDPTFTEGGLKRSPRTSPGPHATPHRKQDSQPHTQWGRETLFSKKRTLSPSVSGALSRRTRRPRRGVRTAPGRALPARRCQGPGAATARPAAPRPRGEGAGRLAPRSALRAASTRRDGQRGGRRTPHSPGASARPAVSRPRAGTGQEGSAPPPELSRAEGFAGTRGAHCPARPSRGPHALAEVAQPPCGAARPAGGEPSPGAERAGGGARLRAPV